MSTRYSKYGRVFDLLPEMIFILDRANNIVDNNRAASHGTGYEAGQLLYTPIEKIVSLGHRAAVLNALKNGKGSQAIEVQFERANRSIIEVSLEVRILETETDSFSVIIAKDITEQKKKELDLLRFSNVIQHTINPIQITDASGKMVYVNPAFERASGYSREELIGKNPRILNSGRHTTEFWKSVWEYIMSHKVWVGKVENNRKDGTPFHSELVISPIVDGNNNLVGFLGAHRDITEQKILEQQLVRSQKMESIGTLAAGIAHEVGNPLTSISSLVQVIQRTTDDDFAKEKLELIKNQINRIARIIRDLVDFSRPSSYIIKPTNVNQIVREALNIVQYGKKVKDINFSIELAEDLPHLRVVPDQLTQVFINILMNSVDALEGKPGSIAVQTMARNNQLEVIIKDTGKGIAIEDSEKIFEPFFTTKEVGQGTGLGLWVSYGIIQNFEGDILVESEPGKGSTFRVMFPIKGE
ncbi:MAG: PAS domain S-box protein [Ignavibacteriales bacterium]|nr:PAS domain S-box protein [Ignavibacteriales bacterium]